LKEKEKSHKSDFGTNSVRGRKICSSEKSFTSLRKTFPYLERDSLHPRERDLIIITRESKGKEEKIKVRVRQTETTPFERQLVSSFP
jgi:hypothetical protein